MAAKEASIPGLVFHIEAQHLGPCVGGEIRAHGIATISADVYDVGVWDRAIEKLNGLVVYAQTVLPEILVEAAQIRAGQAEEEADKVREESRAKIEMLEARNAFQQSELQHLTEERAVLLQELEILRQFKQFVGG